MSNPYPPTVPPVPSTLVDRPVRIVLEHGWITGRAELAMVHVESLAVDLVLPLKDERGAGEDLFVTARPVSRQAQVMAEQIRLRLLRSSGRDEIAADVELAVAEPLAACACDRCARGPVRCFGADLLFLTAVVADGCRTLHEFDRSEPDLSAWLEDEPDAPWRPRTERTASF